MNIQYKTVTNVAKQVFKLVGKPIPLTYIGPGTVTKAVDILKMNQIERVLIVTDKVLHGLGLLDSMIACIEKSGIQYTVYDDVKPDPTFAIVNKALELCTANRCQAMIAFGGGSVIDTAKAAAAAYSNNTTPQALAGLLKVRKRCIPLIAIPTTAGTGSEGTLAAVISDTETHKKSTIVDPNIVPSHAILDPELTVGLPPHITAHTAIDALTHAIEAWVSDYANAETNGYVKAAVTLIYENLLPVYNKPDDIKGREALLVGSLYAGLAFTRTYVGYVHAFAHSIGGKFGVSHGLANAVLLPHVMRFYQDACCDRFAELARIAHLGESTDSNSVLCEKFIQSVFDLNKTLGIPEKLEKFPKAEIPAVIEQGFKEAHGTYPVPKFLTKQEAYDLLSKVAV